MAPFRSAENRGDREHFLGFFWLHAVTKSKMQDISIVPLESGDSHARLSKR